MSQATLTCIWARYVTGHPYLGSDGVGSSSASSSILKTPHSVDSAIINSAQFTKIKFNGIFVWYLAIGAVRAKRLCHS